MIGDMTVEQCVDFCEEFYKGIAGTPNASQVVAWLNKPKTRVMDASEFYTWLGKFDNVEILGMRFTGPNMPTSAYSLAEFISHDEYKGAKFVVGQSGTPCPQPWHPLPEVDL